GRRQHGRVLDLCCNDMAATLAELLRDAPDCQVVSFGTAGNEYDLGRSSADQRRDLASCRLEGGLGLLAKRMHGLGIAHLVREIWQHRCHYFWCRARCRAIVEVNTHKESRVLSPEPWVPTPRPGPELTNQTTSSPRNFNLPTFQRVNVLTCEPSSPVLTPFSSRLV